MKRRRSSPHRTERDALGAIELPAQARYGSQTARALANLSFSRKPLSAYPAYIRALAQVKSAAARTNTEVGLLAKKIGAAIEVACRRMLDRELDDDCVVDVLGGGGSIAVNMNINEVLANAANESLGEALGTYAVVDPKLHVNASQSTADACHTAGRLAIIATWPALRETLAELERGLRARRSEFESVLTLARTCLRDALPTTMATLFIGHADALARRRQALATAIAPLHAVSLGGTVIGTGQGAVPAYRRLVVRRLSEIASCRLRRHPNPSDALQNSDDLGAVSAQLALLARSLMKLAQDLRLLSSGPHGGFGELELPHVQQGSSFFAAKSNPVVPETMLQCGLQVLGCDRAVQAAVEHAELHLNVFDGAAVINVLDAIGMLTLASEKFDRLCVRGLRIDAQRCRTLSQAAAP